MIRSQLETLLHPILFKYTDAPEQFLGMLTRCNDPKFGDYQANFAMSLAKSLGKNPREVAGAMREDILAANTDGMLAGVEVAGPGFLNFTLNDAWMVNLLSAALKNDRLAVPVADVPRTIILDYSSPNVAKPMHVGHIRSTVIGNALYRILKFLGHRVIGDNHLGDWGTQFGMIIYGWKHFRDDDAFAAAPVPELSRLYRLVREKMDADEQIADACRKETERLHSGDAENLSLWKQFMPFCLEEIDRVYDRLDVHFDETLGESFYNDRLPGVVQMLKDKGLARESNGAVCVFFEGRENPMIVQKKDGAYLYATTDIATIEYRMERFSPDAILYVVDHRQSEHFEMLFQCVRMMGYENLELRHVSFGTVLGEDRRPFKTRSGDTVGLEGLLDEAVARAKAVLAENSSDIPPETLEETAQNIGIAALKYADISQNRDSDYIFSYDKMLAMNGNTATYMQYAYARVRSIFTKGGITPEAVISRAELQLTHPAERALAVELLRFTEALEASVKDYRPNFLSAYLYELANRYSTFFESCPVLRAETEALRDSRLLLCDLTARTISQGLELLGIRTVQRM